MAQTNTLRNTKAFVKSFLGSKAGKAALDRKPVMIKHDNGKREMLWRSSQMAHAFHAAVQED